MKKPKQLAPGMRQGSDRHHIQLFCYHCKEYIEVPKKEATKLFKDAGHTNDRVAFMEPDVGRSTRRQVKAVKALAKRNIEMRQAREKAKKELNVDA